MAALSAEVSVASKVKFRLSSSFFILTFDRLVNEVWVSGSNALNTHSNCSLVWNFKRTLALALICSVPTPPATWLLLTDSSP